MPGSHGVFPSSTEEVPNQRRVFAIFTLIPFQGDPSARRTWKLRLGFPDLLVKGSFLRRRAISFKFLSLSFLFFSRLAIDLRARYLRGPGELWSGLVEESRRGPSFFSRRSVLLSCEPSGPCAVLASASIVKVRESRNLKRLTRLRPPECFFFQHSTP